LIAACVSAALLSVRPEVVSLVTATMALLALRSLLGLVVRTLWLLPDWIAKWQCLLGHAAHRTDRFTQAPERSAGHRRRTAPDSRGPS
jgi:hypothetical protein